VEEIYKERKLHHTPKPKEAYSDYIPVKKKGHDEEKTKEIVEEKAGQ